MPRASKLVRSLPRRRSGGSIQAGRIPANTTANRTWLDQQVPILTVDPNFKEDFRLRIINRTIVHEALDVSEERTGTRPRPLYGMRFKARALGAQGTGYIRRVLDLAAELPFGVPLWIEKRKLTAAAAERSLTLAMDSVDNSLWEVHNKYLLLWRSFDVWEVVECSDFTIEEITLARETVMAWEIGDFVIPIIYGSLARSPHKQLTDERGVLDVDFEERFLFGHESIRELTPPAVEVPSTVTMSDCNDIITFRWDGSHDPGISGKRCWVVEAKLGESGIWGDFCVVRGEPPIDGTYFELQIDNVYDGDFYIRAFNFDEQIYNGRYYGTTTQLPTAPDIAIPTAVCTNTTLLATINPALGTTPSDLLRFGGVPKPGNFDEMPYVSPDDVFRTPSYLVDYDDQAGWDGVPTLITLTHADAGVTIRWTRDDTDPSLAVANPGSLDGFLSNAGFYRDDSSLIIRARAFKNGCKSAQMIFLCDKRQPIFGNSFMNVKSSTGGATCENARHARSIDTGMSLPSDCHETSGLPGTHPPCDAFAPFNAALNACAAAAAGASGTVSGPSARALNICEITTFNLINFVAEFPLGACGITWSDGDGVYQSTALYFLSSGYNRPASYNSNPNPYFFAYVKVQIKERQNSGDGVGTLYTMNASGTVTLTFDGERELIHQETDQLFGLGGTALGLTTALDNALADSGMVRGLCMDQFNNATTRYWNDAWLIISRYNFVLYDACTTPI